MSEIFWGSGLSQNHLLTEKIDQKSKYEGPEAVASILAFIAVSKA